jgi:hypothetical protein
MMITRKTGKAFFLLQEFTFNKIVMVCIYPAIEKHETY